MTHPTLRLSRRIVDWALHHEASTRPVALIRIGIVALLWSRFGGGLALGTHPSLAWACLAAFFYASTALLFVGLYTRVASIAVAVVTHVLVYGIALHGGHAEWDRHIHRLLASVTLLLALAPAGASYSWDRLRQVRACARNATPAPAERANLWAVRLIALQVSAVYFWSAFDKARWGFLGGDRMVQFAMHYWLGSASLEDITWVRLVAMIVAWITVLSEFWLAFALHWRRVRAMSIVLGLALHACFAFVLPVAEFSLLMWLLYLAFVDADTLHERLDALHGRAPAA
jgi:hypothetical protein